jgi:hypothetical protein
LPKPVRVRGRRYFDADKADAWLQSQFEGHDVGATAEVGR